ncbi:hypothetical protein K1T71_013884 [Dendrolimus kikuchii]|uniref:Uncharacterized protein n=1 Tax=Dendrolimus kikuchii TaxID=765133 RepID=A0ACC1CG00_9NEOP|nr:hypothetical protein K1T71_013884 [Dendrolimus kikuchii]
MDSDLSNSWCSTTDLTPTLIGIYDSLLEPAKSLKPDTSGVETAKDARNDPPLQGHYIKEETKDNAETKTTNIKQEPKMISGGVKLPIATVNKSSLYTIRTKSDKIGASDEVDKCELTYSDSSVIITEHKTQRTFKEVKHVTEAATFGNLSPNVKRMISSANENTTLKFQKKSFNVGRSSVRHKSNIPLVGATSKISQSGVEILPSVEIYDQPCINKVPAKQKIEDYVTSTVKSEFKIDECQTYDVPTNNRSVIYDVPSNNKTAFESLSLPYIDQSIELSISSNDREFDTKLSPKNISDNIQQKEPTPEASPAKFPKTEGTNSLHRKDFIPKTDSPVKQLLKTIPYPEAIGSTGNLKSFVHDKENRLNPPVAGVPRPLSMSSIASSSSTSSSGVQNKGGVNSAYLASIESLDDHSDVDMTSGAGSNNFVDSAGLNASVSEERHSEDTPQQQQDELPGLSQLERVCAEIVQTENVYVEDLRQVVEGYLHIWRRDVTFSDEELSDLFNNIEDIFAFNRSLCEELNTCHLDATCIARCFVNNTTGFSVYTSYCTGYPRTMERLAALASTPESARAFRERQTALGHLLPLASYLLKPVQRILKYHLLLQNVVKQCASSEIEYALLKMTGIAQHIDDMKRRHEHAVRVQEIQSLLYGWNGPDLTTYGELCAEGTFRVFGAKAMRHAFLFDKMLLVTKNREDGILAYKSHIMCNNMMLVEAILGAPLSFHVIPWDSPRHQLTLQARSLRHKREWTLLLKRVILENYNAVIPSHARQLVMELGQNKTDDDMLAEKSHNLITQASMRKQLSAPEYLEKRKVDRERRKSFENGLRGRLKKGRKLIPNSSGTNDCDCTQISAEKGTDYTCENCYIDLCSDCETELNKDKNKCNCRNDNSDITGDKCPECDRSLQYIDEGSSEHLERKSCKCSDFKSSQESFGKEFAGNLNKTRGYHSSDNIVNYDSKSKEDLTDSSLSNVRNIPKTCLKCAKIKENIEVTDSTSTLIGRRSRCTDDKHKTDTLRSKSKDDPQRSKLSKIGTWRRKSEPGLQQNTVGVISKKAVESDCEKIEIKGTEKIEFECRNCGSNKITRKLRANDGTIISDPELDIRKRGVTSIKPNIEIRMYNTKNIPKKISKIKKNRAKGLRLGSDTTAKFYADFSTDVSTENILHISESNDSLNVDKPKEDIEPQRLSKDEDIDEETYKKLIEKTDSFKKNELEKVKYLNKQKVISEGSELEDKNEAEEKKEVQEICEEEEQPLEQIISQLLMQNREFQKLIKKQQQRNSAQRRHQRLIKTHSSPEQVIVKALDGGKLKPKYGRQMSENLASSAEPIQINATMSNPDLTKDDDEDHIYETLRIENRVDESLHTLNTKSKIIQHSQYINRPKRLPSPPSSVHLSESNKMGPESDYVYLTFDKLNQVQDIDGIYEVPVKSPQKVEKQSDTDYYVTMENQEINDGENIYDSLLEVCRRKKDVPSNLPSDYLPMSPDQQSPNTPEIWLSRQKEHFNVSRDRKSGSLPRSFQIVTSSQEDSSLSSFKCKPNSNSKTYLNREGKVMSTDRPFTIASDQSEISYDDVENYMSEGDILKFNKKSTTETDFVQNLSQSTLDLEEEIDRCYKNNFEDINLDKTKNENVLNTSQPNLNTSTTSSCEVLPIDRVDDKPNDLEVIHPEHKIYKPTSNMLSLKNVLSRFKSKTPNKNSEDAEINANDQSSPDSAKSDLKSPSNEKRSALHPRNYSKNLLQRFRSIIGDEHPDDNQNKPDFKTQQSVDESSTKRDIKVVITSTDSPTTSTIVYSADLLSKSVCEPSSITDSQNEKNNLETLSLSCDNLAKQDFRPSYEKSISMVTNIASLIGSPVKSNNSSYQSLNKLPIYMQGSKHLGARIAQSDYVDPMTLSSEKSSFKNVNVLINKNAVRPDSLFSNSSFVTSSSEGMYQEGSKVNPTMNIEAAKIESPVQENSDESFYEKTFESIEHVTDEDVFRDSAVYSDQDENEDTKAPDTLKDKLLNKTITRIESIKRKTSFKNQVTHTTNERTTYTRTKTQNTEQVRNAIESKIQIKPKIAPPVPAKPKLTQIPVTNSNKNTISKSNLDKSVEGTSSNESINTRTIKRNLNVKQTVMRSESTPMNEKSDIKDVTKTKEEGEGLNEIKPQGLQIKRLSYERASLDSQTRKIKANEKLTEPPKAKSVLERRMEIELLSKNKPSVSFKQAQLPRPKSISTKVATFERSVSDNGRNETKNVQIAEKPNIPNRNSIEPRTDNEDLKSSWVKQVVNKFQ